MHRIVIDWSFIKNEKQMWEEIVIRSGLPDCHGKNLDALNESWVTGIDENGPPYDPIFKNCRKVRNSFKELSLKVMKIAEDSIEVNGGLIAME